MTLFKKHAYACGECGDWTYTTRIGWLGALRMGWHFVREHPNITAQASARFELIPVDGQRNGQRMVTNIGIDRYTLYEMVEDMGMDDQEAIVLEIGGRVALIDHDALAEVDIV